MTFTDGHIFEMLAPPNGSVCVALDLGMIFQRTLDPYLVEMYGFKNAGYDYVHQIARGQDPVNFNIDIFVKK